MEISDEKKRRIQKIFALAKYLDRDTDDVLWSEGVREKENEGFNKFVEEHEEELELDKIKPEDFGFVDEGILQKIKKFTGNLNPIQRIILAIIVPIVVLIMSLAIADEVSGGGYRFFRDMDETWFVWVVAFCIIGFIEYKLFDSKSFEKRQQ